MLQGRQGNLFCTDCPVPLDDLSLEGETVVQAGNETYFRERFVEDGVLKSVVWAKQDLEGKGEVEWVYRLDSFKLDPRGALIWTCRLHSSELRKTLVFTARTKRVLVAESSVESERPSISFLFALAPLGGALLIRDLWYLLIRDLWYATCFLVNIFV